MRGLMIALLLATVSGAGAEKIISGYTGAFYGDKTEAWRSYIPLMKEAGFNCLDFKVHPANFDPADAGYREFVGQVARAVDEAGLQCHLRGGGGTGGPGLVAVGGQAGNHAGDPLFRKLSSETIGHPAVPVRPPGRGAAAGVLEVRLSWVVKSHGSCRARQRGPWPM